MTPQRSGTSSSFPARTFGPFAHPFSHSSPSILTQDWNVFFIPGSYAFLLLLTLSHIPHLFSPFSIVPFCLTVPKTIPPRSPAKHPPSHHPNPPPSSPINVGINSNPYWRAPLLLSRLKSIPPLSPANIPSLHPHSLHPHSLHPHSLHPHSLRPHSLRPHSLRPHSLRPHSLRPHPLRPHSLRPHSLPPSSLPPSVLTPSVLTPPPSSPSNDGISSNPDWRAPLHYQTNRLTTLLDYPQVGTDAYGMCTHAFVCAFLPMSCMPMPCALMPMPRALMPMPRALMPMPCALMPMPRALMLMPRALMPMPRALMPMPRALMPMPRALIPMPRALMPMPRALMPMPCASLMLEAAISKAQLQTPQNTTILRFAVPQSLALSNPALTIYPQKVAADGDYDYRHGGTMYFGWTGFNPNRPSPQEFFVVYNFTTVGAFAITGTSALGTPEAESMVKPHCAAVSTPPYFKINDVQQKNGPVPIAWRLNTTIRAISPTASTVRAVVVFPESRQMWLSFMSAFGKDMIASAVVARLRLSLRLKRKWRPFRVFLERFKVVGVGGGNSLIQPTISLNSWERGEEGVDGKRGRVWGQGKGIIAASLAGRSFYPSAAYATLNANVDVGRINVVGPGKAPLDDYSAYETGRMRYGDYMTATVDEEGNAWAAVQYVAGQPRTEWSNWATFVFKVDLQGGEGNGGNGGSGNYGGSRDNGGGEGDGENGKN
ncbi:unnamed protein product [Closterium sp. Naga37s-1]|nr:unnamed protein product [Closterium sp. Naga37s-1]CAI5524738.1 unnamed protein product [Closterium sp. Naga37s-1]